MLALGAPAHGVLVDFFDASQSYALVQSGTTWDTVRTEGYLFTYSRDKLFTGGTGTVIGRPVSVDWPTGLQAQAVTTGPIGPAKFTITRVDHTVFDFPEFTAKLLANTAGAGGSIEIMPQLGGEDGLPNPVTFDATGIAGNTFTYNTTTPIYLGNTSPLVGFDTYLVTLYVDFAFTDVKLDGLPVPEPSALVLLLGAVSLLVLSHRWRPAAARVRGTREGRDFALAESSRHSHSPSPHAPRSPLPLPHSPHRCVAASRGRSGKTACGPRWRFHRYRYGWMGSGFCEAAQARSRMREPFVRRTELEEFPRRRPMEDGARGKAGVRPHSVRT
jgi:hypothetical protein